MKAFLIDVAKCNGCHNCQISCKDEHCGTEWMPYAADQPMTGHFWCKVEEKVRGSVPVVRVSYTPLVCGHCDDAPCLAAAKDGAVYRRDDGLVVIDPAKAKGQRAIMDACPMGAVYWNEELDLPQKCTGCAHLLDDGWTEPRCVDSCPTGALSFGEEGELDLEGAEPLEALAGLGAHAWYKNLPKRFVAAASWTSIPARSWSAPRPCLRTSRAPRWPAWPPTTSATSCSTRWRPPPTRCALPAGSSPPTCARRT